MDALKIIEASGVKDQGDGQKILEALGYTSIWEGMDMDKVRISREQGRPAAASTAAQHS